MTETQTEYRELVRAVYRYVNLPSWARTDAERADLADLVADYEPSETDQGLIPIPKGYAEP